MKQVIINLYHNAIWNLANMKKSEMSLSDRIKYEKALSQLETIKLILDNYNF